MKHWRDIIKIVTVKASLFLFFSWTACLGLRLKIALSCRFLFFFQWKDFRLFCLIARIFDFLCHKKVTFSISTETIGSWSKLLSFLVSRPKLFHNLLISYCDSDGLVLISPSTLISLKKRCPLKCFFINNIKVIRPQIIWYTRFVSSSWFGFYFPWFMDCY